jgi:hypothetical protein
MDSKISWQGKEYHDKYLVWSWLKKSYFNTNQTIMVFSFLKTHWYCVLSMITQVGMLGLYNVSFYFKL